jgi:transcription initiation factor IIE alpha subunit
MTAGAFAWIGKKFIDYLTKRDDECRAERLEWLVAFQEVRESIRKMNAAVVDRQK